MHLQWARLVIAFALVGAASASYAQNHTAESYAYDTYVRCFNLKRLIIERDLYETLDIEAASSCGDLALEVLERSKSTSSLQYLAHLGLLNTDGAASEDIGAAIAKKKGIKKYLAQAKEEFSRTGSCVLGNVSLPKQAKNLCRAH